jgi:2-polyprenyl-3-methyl-5-hydroxy-6-metoxy-1,4-benzoquinol methylase
MFSWPVLCGHYNLVGTLLAHGVGLRISGVLGRMSTTLTASPNLSASAILMTDIIVDKNPVHQSFMQNALRTIDGDDAEHLSQYLEFCLSSGCDIEYLAECYLTIVEDTLREQIYFRRHNNYRYKSFSEVADKVYFDAPYMAKYMYGLAITMFLWPNHVAMARFFVRSLPSQQSGKYLEIGPGHGYFLMRAMQNSKYQHFYGLDISQTSIDQTATIVNHFMPEMEQSLELRCMDFLAAQELRPNEFDAIVMGEVLEHVEAPTAFLERIADIAKPDAHIFVTTCINAPAVDHIYLWRHPADLEKMIEGCGLDIVEALHLPYAGKTVDECVVENLAVNVAYVLAKK